MLKDIFSHKKHIFSHVSSVQKGPTPQVWEKRKALDVERVLYWQQL